MTLTINNDFKMKQYVKIPADCAFSNDFVFKFPKSTSQETPTTKPFWDTDIKALVQNSVEQMGISAYSLSMLKNDNIAIAKSQKHLIDLIKYYEGDKNYYYEAVTEPYKDKYGTLTCGFGELTNKPMTSQQAYQSMCKKVTQASSEVKNLLNKRIGNETYEKLPNSIKEALIDLCYNKGLGSISGNKALMSAIKSKDYSAVIKNSVYVYSGKKDAPKEEDPGLWRRSLSRAILALRDLQGEELKQGKQEVETIYKKAVACHKAQNISTIELEKIYEQYKDGKISSAAHSAESYKMKIDEQYRGKGLFSVAQSAYKALGETDITFEKFYKELKRINKDPDSIRVGQELKIPYVMAEQKLPDAPVNVVNQEQKQEEVQEKTEKPGFWSKLWQGVKNVFSAIGDFLKKLLPKSKTVEAEKSKFQKMLETASIEQKGEFQVISQEYKIKKGNTLWSLSREFGTTEDIICNDNNIADKHVINEGQTIRIQKLGYKVKDGDDLAKIAEKFGLSNEILMDLNNIEEVEAIKPNQILEIPGFIYKVRPGDTLTKISHEVGVKLDDLIKINGLQSDVIKPDQEIFVVYNNSDYAVSSDRKKVVVDEATNTKTEIVDMSNDAKLAKRPLLKQKRRVNGQVQATRDVLEPTKAGKLSGKTIIVNAGHGYSQAGTDPGVLSPGGIDDEWLLNYDNAMRLTSKLRAQGAKVIFIQGHVNLITKELAKKNNKADMFISVHVNANDKPTSDRTQIYASTNKSQINDKSCKLANIMETKFDKWIPKHENISKKDAFVNNGKQDYAQAKQANYAVIRESEKKQNIPSVLWEVAFMVSPKGRERLASPKLMDNYSDIMTQSIIEYFNG